MNDKELAGLLKYSHPKQLYIVTWNNVLKLLFCPFKVQVLKDIGTLRKDKIVWVEKVKVTSDLKTVYIVEGKNYYYHHFNILIS